MKNKPEDLYNILFAELERLSDESLRGNDLMEECERATKVCQVAMAAIAEQNVVLKSVEIIDGSFCKFKLPDFVGVNTDTAVIPDTAITNREKLLLVKKNA
jgi:hypothetical protein